MSDGGAVSAGRARIAWSIAALSIGIFMVVIDNVGLSVALPTIAADLQVTEASAIWLVTAFQMSVAATLFPLASLADRLGHHRVYTGGIVLIALAAIANALLPGLGPRIVARALQGIGAAGVMAVHLALLRNTLPPALLGRGVALNTLLVAVSAASGPVVVGAVLSTLDWRWLFLLQVPLALLILPMALLALPRVPTAVRPFDRTGALALGLSIVLLVVALDGLGRGWPPAALAGALGGACLLMWLTVRHQRRSASPVLPVDLLAFPVVRLSALTAVFAYTAQGLVYVGLPFHLHDTLGLGAGATGLSMVPWPIGITLASILVARLLDRHSAGLLGTGGLVLLGAALAALAFGIAEGGYVPLILCMFVCGLGFGMFQAPNTLAILNAAPGHRAAAASALQSGARLLGQASGAALSAMAFAISGGSGSLAAVLMAAVFVACAAAISALRLRVRPA